MKTEQRNKKKGERPLQYIIKKKRDREHTFVSYLFQVSKIQRVDNNENENENKIKQKGHTYVAKTCGGSVSVP